MDENYRFSESSDSRRINPDNDIAPVMSLLDWVIVLVISILPLANVIVMLFWAFGNTDNPNRRNFARAFLLIAAAWSVITAILIGQFTGMIINALNML